MALELSDIQTAYQHVLVGVDESEQGQVALASAVHQALEDQAKLTIATVLELGDLSTTDVLSLSAVNKRREDLEKNLQTYKAYAIEQGVTEVESVLADGAKAGEVLAMEL
ncbi:MAG: universal stress protein, partial [Weissella confusa]|nr:universal stress protein [Weissella confusa]